MISRRALVSGAVAAGAAAMLPRFAFADAATDARFVLVLLRGALDGLAAVPAYGDGSYASKRGSLAITSPQLKLDGMFALHPSLTRLHVLFQARQLTVFHAVASPYRERSHFDGQDLLENGTTSPKSVRKRSAFSRSGRSKIRWASALAFTVGFGWRAGCGGRSGCIREPEDVRTCREILIS